MPAVTLIRPVCGLDNHAEETLASSFALDESRIEIIFCVASARDPAAPVVKALFAKHPGGRARLLIGDERISANPKLNNCLKGWNAAAHEWIIIADSNVLIPPDYVERLFARWDCGTGLVCSPPIGAQPRGFWAEVECAFLNTYQARVQYFADTRGLGFAQGKSMLWRRADLDRAGGLKALAAEAAEDAAATKLVRAAGLSVRLVDSPFEQPLGKRSAREVWTRQVRWARLRRASFPGYFALEILGGAIPPFIAAAFIAAAAGYSPSACLAVFAAAWYGAEMLLAHAAGWHLSPLYPLHAALRDLALPVLWIDGWLGSGFVWRGNRMSLAADGALDPRT